MSALPSGVVAFVMTDVEASTKGWNASAPAMDAAIQVLDAAVHDAVKRHDGVVVKARGEGDSHFAAFSTASAAVAAAADIQRRPDDGLAVRACVVLAEAVPRDGDYLGAAINHGARLRSAAHGGQVVVTRAVVDLAARAADDGFTFRSLGVHRVRDIDEPVEMFQLCGAGLGASFPPLNTAGQGASAMMAIVFVDEVSASSRFKGADRDALLEWQRDLISTLRTAADLHDGRFQKFVGDGCLVGFEDPRAAVAFAEAVCGETGALRAAVAVGVVDIVEGELLGAAVVEAARLVRRAAAGQVLRTDLVSALL